MGAERFRHALRAIVAEDLTETADLWPEVRKRAGKKPFARSPLQITRPGWGAAILVLTLAFGSVAYAAITSMLDRAVEMDPSGSQYLVENGLVERLNLSQTEGGITTTLEWAYADANRIVIAYTIAHPADRESTSVRLTDEDGTALADIMGGYGYVGDGLSSQVESFDASPVRGAPDSLGLSLHLEVSTFDLPEGTPSPPPVTVDPETGVGVAVLEPVEIGAPSAAFDFEFSVPFHPGREVEIRQVVEVSGIRAALEQAVVAPSDARFTLCFSGLDPAYQWIPLFSLKTPEVDLDDNAYILSGGQWVDDRCYQYDVGAPLQEHRGEWTLTVKELVGERLDLQPGQIRLSGPWGFRFLVP